MVKRDALVFETYVSNVAKESHLPSVCRILVALHKTFDHLMLVESFILKNPS